MIRTWKQKQDNESPKGGGRNAARGQRGEVGAGNHCCLQARGGSSRFWGFAVLGEVAFCSVESEWVFDVEEWCGQRPGSWNRKIFITKRGLSFPGKCDEDSGLIHPLRPIPKRQDC